jgi:periplasmic protein TonB
MFEDSTFESNGAIRTRSRAWMIAAFAFNASILLALILIPLFYPEALTAKSISFLMTTPPAPVEQPKPVVRPEHEVSAAPALGNPFVAPARIPHGYPSAAPPDSAENSTWIALGPDGSGSPNGGFQGTGVSPVVVQTPVGPRPIPSVLAQGLLIRKVIPRYPSIGIAVHAEGTVVLQATISKTGTIENLRVVSGPALLQQAAIEAVKQWQYRPYLLNGQPVEVETTVNVDFKMN